MQISGTGSHLELALHEGPEIALEWANSRASLKRPYRDLLLGLEFLEVAAKRPLRKIVDATPSEQRSTTAERISVALEFLSQLHSKLMRN